MATDGVCYQSQAELIKLKTCGLHHYNSLPDKTKSAIREELILNDLTYNISTNFMYAYKANCSAMVSIDMNEKGIYMTIVQTKDDKHIKHLLTQLMGRFRQFQYVVIERCPKSFLKQSLESLPFHIHADDINVIACRLRNNKGTLVIPNGELIFDKQNSVGAKHHTQIISFQPDQINILFDPPIVFRQFDDEDEHIIIKTPITSLKPSLSGTYPRWNKLRYHAQDDNLAIYTNAGYYELRYSMSIPLKMKLHSFKTMQIN